MSLASALGNQEALLKQLAKDGYKPLTTVNVGEYDIQPDSAMAVFSKQMSTNKTAVFDKDNFGNTMTFIHFAFDFDLMKSGVSQNDPRVDRTRTRVRNTENHYQKHADFFDLVQKEKTNRVYVYQKTDGKWFFGTPSDATKGLKKARKADALDKILLNEDSATLSKIDTLLRMDSRSGEVELKTTDFIYETKLFMRSAGNVVYSITPSTMSAIESNDPATFKMLWDAAKATAKGIKSFLVITVSKFTANGIETFYPKPEEHSVLA